MTAYIDTADSHFFRGLPTCLEHVYSRNPKMDFIEDVQDLLTVNVVMLLFACAAVGLRFLAKKGLSWSVGVDDYLIIVALVRPRLFTENKVI